MSFTDFRQTVSAVAAGSACFHVVNDGPCMLYDRI